ncbi:MAG TPA: restriction endonuclease [Candidatus Kapabacteria bacterium]|nr:restriction endonuclease [Candidatus Kapabacteria bacterium]
MNKKLSPQFIQLTQDACLKAFWRKGALRLFLKQHKIADSSLKTLYGDESKRQFLDRLFNKLIALNENKGHDVILEIAKSLSEMTHFPDLEGWEDSKTKIDTAKEAVTRLKDLLNELKKQVVDEEARNRRQKEAYEKNQKNNFSQESLEKLKEKLDHFITKQGTQDAGYDFEKWFYELAIYFDIDARSPYRADGRQIDGALTLEGTTFLMEAKFTKEKSGPTDIDSFMAKVTSKADNTMGIFVSMAGFNEGAIKAASRDRTPLLLMDHSHFYNLILPGLMTLPDVIKRIKRHASQTGDAFLDIRKFSG